MEGVKIKMPIGVDGLRRNRKWVCKVETCEKYTFLQDKPKMLKKRIQQHLLLRRELMLYSAASLAAYTELMLYSAAPLAA